MDEKSLDLFLGKQSLVPIIGIAFPDQHTFSIVAFRTTLVEMKYFRICHHSSPKLVPRVN
jgi:hypothetical protein